MASMAKGSAKRNGKGVYDALIAGGGMVGLTLGIGLASCGLKAAVVDAMKPKTQLDPTFDGRSSAIAYASQRMLEAIGIWKHIGDRAEPIRDIRVSERGSRLFVHFDSRAAGKKPMGFMVENRHFRHALHKRRAELKALDFIAPAKVEGFTARPGFGEVELSEGKNLKTALCAAAEGRGSALREAAGLTQTRLDYGQAAIVATIKHTLPHHGIAHEKFFPEGPFAILPLKRNHASLVWSTRREHAPVIMALSQAAFEAELQARIGGFLGEIKALPGRWQFPLGFQLSDRYTAERLVLVGDAAHGIHPIAGQGLNMGFRDIAALVEVLVKAKALGEDLGSLPVLERYVRWRRTDNYLLSVITDTLTRGFSNDIAPVKLARGLGLGISHRIPPLKRFFVNHARGTLGKLPALLEGERPRP